jgi:hypothetical protein
MQLLLLLLLLRRRRRSTVTEGEGCGSRALRVGLRAEPHGDGPRHGDRVKAAARRHSARLRSGGRRLP